MKNMFVLASFVGMISLVACGGDKTDAAASGSASAKPAGSAASSGAPKKDEPAAKKPMTLAEFTTDAPTAACKALVACKNEEITVSIGTGLQMMAGFGGMEDPKIAAEMKTMGEAMKKDNRQLMNAGECTTVMGIVTNMSGFNAAKLQAAVDAKKVEFNGEKAAACVAALASEPAACKEEKKVKADLKLGDLENMMKPYEKDFDQHMKSCEEALVGKVAAGEACEYDFECAGEKSNCKNKKCEAKK